MITPMVGIAQEKTKAIISLYNGSILHGTPEFQSIKITLKYGNLDIPIKDILKIDVGYHLETENQNKLDKALKDLSSNVHATREIADKYLRSQYEDSFYLLKSFKSSDREVTKRIEQIITYIRDNKDARLYDKFSEDTIYLMNGEIYKGKISGRDKYELSTKNLGKVEASLSGIKEIVLTNNRKMDFSIKEVTNEWKDSGIVVVGKFSIKATGVFDLYPGEPERYISGPNGSTSNGKSGIYKAGSLLIRLNGTITMCGESFSGFANGVHSLEFMVERPYWDGSQQNAQPIIGEYKIEVTQQ